MGKWIRGILIAVLAAVFLFSAGKLLGIEGGYRESRKTYSGAAEEYTKPAEVTAAVSAEDEAPAGGEPAAEREAERELIYAPIEVDFDYLCRINSDVIGWIYCPDTVINYPVVWGRDNDYYLERNYRGEPDSSGTIFADAGNMKDLTDSNIILYGHHMQDMSMFATLKYWLKQEYYEEHPVMWLLTPEQDYRIELFSGYVTSAESETYTIFRGAGEEFDAYLRSALARSEFRAETELDATGKYVLLSTCAYSFQLARTVLHGRLIPVDSAGGLPIEHSAAADEGQ